MRTKNALIKKIHTDAISKLMKNDRVVYQHLDQNHILITTTGYYAHVLESHDVYLDLSKCRETTALVPADYASSCKIYPCVLTSEYVYHDKLKCMVAKLRKRDTDTVVYVQEKILKEFDGDGVTFYQSKKDPLSLIYVFKDDNLIGLVYPTRAE